MAREEVTQSELVEIINYELSQQKDCPTCRVSGVMALQEPDEDGCNWSEPAVSCGGISAMVWGPAAARVIARVRTQYNLKQ